MANPNLANINQYFSRTIALFANGSSGANILFNSTTSNSVLKINSLIAYNTNTTNTGSLIISFFRLSSNLSSNIFNVTLAPQSNVVTLIDRNSELCLEEGDALRATSNISNTISVIASYDVVREVTDIPLEYLVVAGGGAGGTSSGALGISGGGGAGGFTLGSGAVVSTGTNYTIIIGAGGATNETKGSNSSIVGGTSPSIFTTPGIVSIGGGRGGMGNETGGSAGSNGGSGGGGTWTQAAGIGTAGPPRQGYDGGVGTNTGPNYGGGGGGGSGGVGTNGTSTTGGPGGPGTINSITGLSITYAGGGGGGSYSGGTAGTGGSGGGGAGTNGPTSGASGTVNTGGGGGGGGGATGSGGAGGTGGSGIVILRHPTDYRTANTTGNVTITSNVGYVIYQFNGSGSITF